MPDPGLEGGLDKTVRFLSCRPGVPSGQEQRGPEPPEESAIGRLALGSLCLLPPPLWLGNLGYGSSGVTWPLLVADLRPAGLETPKGPLRRPATPAPGQRQRPRVVPDSPRAGVGSAY